MTRILSRAFFFLSMVYLLGGHSNAQASPQTVANRLVTARIESEKFSNNVRCETVMESQDVSRTRGSARTELAAAIIKKIHMRTINGGPCAKDSSAEAKNYFCIDYCSNARNKACTPSCVKICADMKDMPYPVQQCMESGGRIRNLADKAKKIAGKVTKSLGSFQES